MRKFCECHFLRYNNSFVKMSAIFLQFSPISANEATIHRSSVMVDLRIEDRIKRSPVKTEDPSLFEISPQFYLFIYFIYFILFYFIFIYLFIVFFFFFLFLFFFFFFFFCCCCFWQKSKKVNEKKMSCRMSPTYFYCHYCCGIPRRI